MFQKTVLKNGLRIITVPQKSTQAVTVLVLVETGSKYEEKETSGISHLLEHLLFKGTKKRPSHLQIAEPLDRVGGMYNAFTGEEYTGYFAKVASRHFGLALDIIADIYLHSQLNQKEIEKEKGVVIEEINMYFDHPSSYVQTLWDKLLYGDQPAGWDIAGTKESVRGISRKALVDYMNRQYVAPSTVVCIAGNIPSHKEVVRRVNKHFAGISQKEHRDKPAVVEKQTRPECQIHYRATGQTHLCLGVRGYNLFHPQKFAQDLMAELLGGMMSSRLFITIREKLGLAYYVKTVASFHTDTGYVVTQAGVDNKRLTKAITAILKEYKKIATTKVSSQELQKVKDHVKGKNALLLEASDARAMLYGMQEILEKKILTPKEIYAKIDAVGSDDILAVAKDMFRSQKLNLALVGPFKDKAKFQKLLHL